MIVTFFFKPFSFFSIFTITLPLESFFTKSLMVNVALPKTDGLDSLVSYFVKIRNNSYHNELDSHLFLWFCKYIIQCFWVLSEREIPSNRFIAINHFRRDLKSSGFPLVFFFFPFYKFYIDRIANEACWYFQFHQIADYEPQVKS